MMKTTKRGMTTKRNATMTGPHPPGTATVRDSKEGGE
jgi:hypothetical protein